MHTFTRRQTFTLLAAGSAIWLAPLPAAQAQAKASSSHNLAEAIRTFNTQATRNPIGKTQPPLTEGEVIAAIRWINASRTEPGIKDEEYAALLNVADTQQLPPGAELEVLTEFEPNHTIVVTAWSVRLRMPHGQYRGSYAFPIREQNISSRLIGPEERKVIRKWEKRWQEQGGIRSFDRSAYTQERHQAEQLDQANQK